MEKDEHPRLWAAHCHQMAEATYAVADWCEEPEMIRGYLALAAQWLRLAESPAQARRSDLSLPPLREPLAAVMAGGSQTAK